MEIRVLRYFLAIAREENFSRAADVLYLSQPTLSRQIRELEEELGVQLFERTNRNVRLTREGLRLRNRAQEIVSLAEKTLEEFRQREETLEGEVHLGSGETYRFSAIASTIARLRRAHPGIRVHLHSGNADDIAERLDRGLLDFGVLLAPGDLRRYETLPLPGGDEWGLLMPENHPLAGREAVRPQDLDRLPLLVSAQSMGSHSLPDWLRNAAQPEIVGTYNLLYNASLLVKEGIACALCLDRLISAGPGSGLCFRPLTPPQTLREYLVWKRYQLLSPVSEAFLRAARETFAEAENRL